MIQISRQTRGFTGAGSIISAILLIVSFCTSLSAKAESDLKISVEPSPATPQTGENTLWIQITDEQNLPVVDAEIGLLIYMPAMGTMPRMEEKATISSNNKGRYGATYMLSMGGSWEMTLNIAARGKKKTLRYSVTTDIPGVLDKNSSGMDTSNSSEVLDIGPARLQLIGVRFSEAKNVQLSKTVRAVGIVEQDNTHREDVTVRFSGYVSKIFTGRVGDNVKKGQPLFSVYSPDLVTAQSEYLLSVKTSDTSHSLVASAEARLQNLGMTEAQIMNLKATGKSQREIIVRSPIAGTILRVGASDGTAIGAGQAVITVGDLNKSYIVARVFQQDVGDVKAGQAVEIGLPSAPGYAHKGQVDLVFPQFELGTGTANVRVQNLDPLLDLRPGVYVDLRFPLALGEGLVVPVDALLYSGLHNYVFVDRGNGLLEPREVFPGRFVGDSVEIRKGLAPGERVAASGTFLLSSEAQLRSALPKWSVQDSNEKKMDSQ